MWIKIKYENTEYLGAVSGKSPDLIFSGVSILGDRIENLKWSTIDSKDVFKFPGYSETPRWLSVVEDGLPTTKPLEQLRILFKRSDNTCIYHDGLFQYNPDGTYWYARYDTCTDRFIEWDECIGKKRESLMRITHYIIIETNKTILDIISKESDI